MINNRFLKGLSSLQDHESKRFLVACSGGLDSMVLVHLCVKHGLKFEMAHVNYQLRGEDSEADASLVQSFGAEQNIQVHVMRLDTEALLAASKESLQMLARRKRYEWFYQLMNERQIDVLLTAHHQNDAIESFFLNLLRGTGIKGLRGILNQSSIYRPLLACTKEELYQYAKDQNITFREDQSNETSKYQRNWLRNELFPMIRERIPDFDKIMSKNIDHLHEDYQMLQAIIQEDILNANLSIEDGMIEFLKIKKLKYPSRALFQLFEPFGFNRDQISSVIEAIQDQNTGAVFYSNTHQILIDRKALILEAKAVHTEHWAVSIDQHTKTMDVPISLKFQFQEPSALSRNPNQLHFDADELKFPLQLRLWQKGDRMSLFGMKGTKKVSDILIDEKKHRFEKAQTYVLENEQGILSVVGVRRSNIAIVKPHSQKIFTITLGHE